MFVIDEFAFEVLSNVKFYGAPTDGINGVHRMTSTNFVNVSFYSSKCAGQKLLEGNRQDEKLLKITKPTLAI